MALYTLVVLSNPVEGREAEFKRWYIDEHVPDVLKLDGFVSAKIMPASTCQPQPEMAKRWKYIGLFELDTDDPEGTIAELNRQLGTPVMPVSDAFDLANMHVTMFEAD